MAGGGFVVEGRGRNYEGGVTGFVIVTCLVAAMGGLLFGYDLGISGGVTSMPSFLDQFFPSVVKKMKSAHESEYCKFDSELLTLFTSSLYLAALVASFAASVVTRKFGRKPSMFFGGLSFLLGSILNGVANSIALLIIGRLLLGVGVGFANQVCIQFILNSLSFVTNTDIFIHVYESIHQSFVHSWLLHSCSFSLSQFTFLKWHQPKSEELSIWASKWPLQSASWWQVLSMSVQPKSKADGDGESHSLSPRSPP